MTRYAYDAERCTLVATWGSGVGELASDVPARLEEVPMEEAQHLAAGLTNLSSALWWAYTHPASSADSLELNSEGWRREQERAAFGDVLTALRSPNLPHDDGILRSYSPIQEAAHTVGRVLHALDDHSVTNAVCADVAEELAAVERRTRQPDRARRQAVLMDRVDASPVQVAAAHRLLERQPFGAKRLFTEVEPTAAAIAATHWLAAAAQMTSAEVGIDGVRVVEEADDIEALPVEVPALVLSRIAAGESPRQVVVSLVRDAMSVADGELPNLNALVAQIVEAETRAAQYGDRADEVREALLPTRVTPLDPKRPARNLLEDLLAGIHGCWLIYQAHAAEGEDQDELMELFLSTVREEAAQPTEWLV